MLESEACPSVLSEARAFPAARHVICACVYQVPGTHVRISVVCTRWESWCSRGELSKYWYYVSIYFEVRPPVIYTRSEYASYILYANVRSARFPLRFCCCCCIMYRYLVFVLYQVLGKNCVCW